MAVAAVVHIIMVQAMEAMEVMEVHSHQPFWQQSLAQAHTDHMEEATEAAAVVVVSVLIRFKQHEMLITIILPNKLALIAIGFNFFWK